MYIYNGTDWAEFGLEVDLSQYAKLTDLPEKISQLENDEGYIKKEADPSFAAQSGFFATKDELFSGSYNDLTNKPLIPTKISDLANDSNFLTEHQPLNEYVTKNELSGLINDITDNLNPIESKLSIDDSISSLITLAKTENDSSLKITSAISGNGVLRVENGNVSFIEAPKQGNYLLAFENGEFKWYEYTTCEDACSGQN